MSENLAAVVFVALMFLVYHVGKSRGRDEVWDDLEDLEETLNDLIASFQRKKEDKDE